MNKKQIRHKRFDFTVTEISLVVTLVAVIAGIGIYVNQVKQSSNAIYAAAQTSSASPQAVNPAVLKAGNPVTYLDISEWGVRLPLTESLKDAYYVIRAGGPDTVFLGLHSVTTLTPRCAPDDMALGIIYRLSDDKQAAAIAYVEAEGDAGYSSLNHTIHINGYYYGFESLTANCADSKNAAALRLFRQLRPDVGFAAAARIMTAIPGS